MVAQAIVDLLYWLVGHEILRFPDLSDMSMDHTSRRLGTEMD